MTAGGIVMIVSGFPRRSETFAINELLALDRRGALAAVFATKAGDGAPPQPGAGLLSRPVQVLEPGTPIEQAEQVVERLRGRRVAGVHAYFAHQPAEVAAQAARRLDRPFGFSAHARDARKITRQQLWDRARRAACVVACNTDVATEFCASGAPVHLVPHGVDLQRFLPSVAPRNQRVRLLAVGRLVPKKGFDVLIAAAARLPVPFRLNIIGEGPDRSHLSHQIERFGLTESVTLRGGQTHAELPGEYADADLVVVPSIVDDTGDRDGLPNVALEALASGRPIVASDVGAIRSAVVDRETGRLVPAGNEAALACAIEVLARDPDLRERMGQAGRALAEREFDLDRCTARLAELLGHAYV
jgi:glycosyltransferase involved in cell wall biosynthesis